ncbi:MAG: peptidoglycan DD-metalloendopeptidase family protein [Alphaproteobacteria bacterium]|nr:peptidoglycan DD-metalloendopeptidase family protein [Alphaproteobacteria bacterium]
MTSQSQHIWANQAPNITRNISHRTRQTLLSALEITIDTLHLKKRYVLTRGNRLRLRYLVSGVAGLALSIGLYTGGQIEQQPASDINLIPGLAAPTSSAQAADHILSMVMPQSTTGAHSTILSALDHFRDGSGQIRRDREVLKTVELLAEDETQSPGAQEKTIEISKGDTFGEALMSAGLGGTETQTVISEIGRHYNLRGLKPGQQFSLTMEPADTESGYQFAKMSFSPDPLRTIEVFRDDKGNVSSKIDEKQITKKFESREVEIDGSVYGSADKADLPDRITANTISLFSYAIDFQRDIHQGDKMEVFYDSYRTDDGYLAKTGDIVFARMTLREKQYAFYRYETLDGHVDYYTQDGKSIRKSAGLMKTPVSFGRMSSGFGVRQHPVLGYTRMHKGVDFAAPKGTKIFAAGDGVIERASRLGTFGNYVRIRHNSKLSTAYAHLNGYAKGIHPGVRVKQGQLIGYVGTTGRSTGPHLHYEVLVNGVQVNPRSVKVTVDNSLKGKDLNRFKNKIREINQEYAQGLSNDKIKLASNE